MGRVKKNKKIQRRHSNFYIGLHGKDWVESCELFAVESQALMQLSPREKLDNIGQSFPVDRLGAPCQSVLGQNEPEE